MVWYAPGRRWRLHKSQARERVWTAREIAFSISERVCIYIYIRLNRG